MDSDFPKTDRTSAFTLVELVVVIAILAILGTIGFLSTSGYSSRARDSERVADVINLSKSLELVMVTAGNYPIPDNAFSITYSGGIVWQQGSVGSRVMQAIHASVSGGWLAKKPLDPLDATEFPYSVTAFGKAYQIEVDYEGDLTVASRRLAPSIVDETYAAPGLPTLAYVRGNFGWLVAKTNTGGITYVLAVPSILTNSGVAAGTSVELRTNALSWTLLFHGRNLVSASSFNPVTVVFSGSVAPTLDAQVIAMVNALRSAYSGSNIASNSAIANLLNTQTGGLLDIGNSMMVNSLEWNAVGITPPVSGPCNGIPASATYFNGSGTGYSLVNAIWGTSLAASYNAAPATNTCQFKCSSPTTWDGSTCNPLLARWRVNAGNANTDYLAYAAPYSFSFDSSLTTYQTACATYGKNVYKNDGTGGGIPSCGGNFVNAGKSAYGGCGNSTWPTQATSSKTYYNPGYLPGKHIAWFYYNSYSGNIYGDSSCGWSVTSSGDGLALCPSGSVNGNQAASVSVNTGDVIVCQDP